MKTRREMGAFMMVSCVLDEDDEIDSNGFENEKW